MDIVALVVWILAAMLLVGVFLVGVGVRLSMSAKISERQRGYLDFTSGLGMGLTGIGGAGLLFVLVNWPP